MFMCRHLSLLHCGWWITSEIFILLNTVKQLHIPGCLLQRQFLTTWLTEWIQTWASGKEERGEDGLRGRSIIPLCIDYSIKVAWRSKKTDQSPVQIPVWGETLRSETSHDVCVPLIAPRHEAVKQEKKKSGVNNNERKTTLFKKDTID